MGGQVTDRSPSDKEQHMDKQIGCAVIAGVVLAFVIAALLVAVLA